MAKPLIAKLEHFTKLSRDDKEVLRSAAAIRVRQLGPREDVIREGDNPNHVNLILSGWACRYKVLEDGRRQIMSYFVPGDFCDLKIFILKSMDHSIGTLSAVSLAEIPQEAIQAMTERHTRLAQALWWSSLVAEAIEREWIVNLGQRDALERVGHLFCELYLRLQAVGLAENGSFELPVTQSQLGETMGLSSVHVNRTVQELRSKGLIVLRDRRVTIPDLERLKAASMFVENYLHLGREGRELDANET